MDQLVQLNLIQLLQEILDQLVQSNLGQTKFESARPFEFD